MEIKEGDYFSYCWNEKEFSAWSDPYWCRDRRCVATLNKEGKIELIDTFNYWPYDGGELEKEIFTRKGLAREYSRYVDPSKVELTFICNLSNYEFVSEYNKDDYDDVVYVGYQLTKRWAILKGSEKSKSAILSKLHDRLADYESKKQSAEWGIERTLREIEELKE